jgi:hypothetical protein
MFAQSGNVPMSGEWSNPGSWGTFFTNVGVPAGILVLVLVIGAVLAFFALRWTVGQKGWVKGVVTEVGESWKKAGAKVEECLP